MMSALPYGFLPLPTSRCVLCGFRDPPRLAEHGSRTSAVLGVQRSTINHNAEPLARGQCCDPCNQAVILVSGRCSANNMIFRSHVGSYPANSPCRRHEASFYSLHITLSFE